MKRIAAPVLGLVGALTLGACTDTDVFSPEFTEPSFQRGVSSAAPAKTSASIAEIAINDPDGRFTQLVAALSYVDAELGTGLVDLFLNGRDQYTVFAPTNQAFENLYVLLSAVLGADIDEITDVPAPVVKDVLFYHVTEGRRASNSVVPRNRDGEREITTLLGEMFKVRSDLTIEDGLTGLRDDARIISADISARNGIIHVIDQVIVSPNVVAALVQ